MHIVCSILKNLGTRLYFTWPLRFPLGADISWLTQMEADGGGVLPPGFDLSHEVLYHQILLKL
jgi:hypothetical protein